MPTQNIYDDPDFFENYSRLERSREGLSGAAEWSSLRALLPDLSGRRIVDLGCGYGWFCRWARDHGAERVLGLDVSERMLTRATAMTSDPGIAYRRADLERLDLGTDTFDFAYSSLALHYIENLPGLLAELHRALLPGSTFVFSVEHPIVTAPIPAGWSVGADGRRTWPVDSYHEEGPRRTNWLAEGVIKQHRTLGTYLNLLIRLGFTIAHVEEWAPTHEQVAARPDWAEERERPMFLLIAAQR
ncbi:class I SAM-dependent methyltransferase [Microvirga lotononidis]|uniref:Methylase involved in ubiquinone/menaquinone biosynthesis n=1 Tax=Microvirga lotononidis TaxID=864069 RepID=I4YZ86_9HYPH|nr:class I SAM-dependent methyltransferase [Microvirga lotononidis]EIM29278.1 methylase involved in ubiquinone/menaquinone biosynthesis [Microvirga lotononidis]WQO29105.1 class I SAM-dependent methyltransferase [Microvirga lotononidis]